VAATFHIFNHAAFKAGLFLVVGIVDHQTGTRDKRVLLQLGRFMPVTATVCGACALASAGVPLLNGFLSKELFYEAAFAQAHAGGMAWLWPVMAVGGSVFTFVYSMEVFHGIFFSRRQELVATVLPEPGPHHAAPDKTPHDPGWGMLAPVSALAVVCVLVGLWPALFQQWMVEPAVRAIWQGPVEFDIELFHGFSAPVMMSILTVAAGLVMYAQRHRLMAVQHRLAWPFTAHTVYDACVKGLVHGATRLTDALQDGRLRTYLWITVAFFLTLTGVLLGRSGVAAWIPATWTTAGAGELALLALLVMAALAVVALDRQRVPAVIALSSVGALVSGLFLVMSAPDLALTQLLVEAVTGILFLLVLWFLPKQTPVTSTRRARAADTVLAVAFGGMMTLVVLGVFASGQRVRTLTDYFEAKSLAEAGGRNIVNVILVDFRGFDTLGETTVLCIAALGAYALVKFRRKRTEAGE
jgi:NADH:ubiquinone oxidoreductase subunit 5 (subunit L)/multisubunit Na+/H+ antiporter MnhA subunit